MTNTIKNKRPGDEAVNALAQELDRLAMERANTFWADEDPLDTSEAERE